MCLHVGLNEASSLLSAPLARNWGERRSECVYANYSVRDGVNSFLCFLKLLRNSKYSITLNWLINQDLPPMEYKDLLKK